MANAAGSKSDDRETGSDGAAASAANPLMMHPAAAFAAATAIGFSFQTQMASAFFGALQNAVDVGQKFSAMMEKQIAESKTATPQVRKAETPAVVPVVVAEKPAVAEPVVAKADNVVPLKPVAKIEKPAPDVVEAKAELQPKIDGKSKADAKVTTARVDAGVEEKPKGEAIAEPVAKAEPVVKAKAVAKAKAEKPAAVAKPARVKADDLKRITGIGPKLEQVLNGMGVRRFADIAGWSEDEMKRVDSELGFAGRIGRDDWIGQAKALAGARSGKK